LSGSGDHNPPKYHIVSAAPPNITRLEYKHDDGGRESAGYHGKAKDCVCRAITIAGQFSYEAIYKELAQGNADQRNTKRSGVASGKWTADRGINTSRKWFKDFMVRMGFRWVSCMKIGEGCKTHLRAAELPMGRLVVRVSGHLCAVINGVIHDNHNPDRGGNRCVYGYWIADS